MENTFSDVMEYVREEDVKFIRLAFCDLAGNVKNASIMPDMLEKAFRHGIAFDGSAVKGFEDPEKSDLFLFPDPKMLTLLPWRPSHGKVIRLFCDIKHPDGTPYEYDCRNILKKAVNYAAEKGIRCNFGTEFEFYLFKLDENGNKTDIPCDNAGYMDVAPQDKGENIRREICLTIEEMGLYPECSHHEEGPGQNEIDFKYSDPISAADQAVIFKNAAQIIAHKNGYFATFDPKPIADKSGSGLHINVSVNSDDGKDVSEAFIAGVLKHIKEMTYFLNPTTGSYDRLGEMKAPKKIFAADENRSALIRIPATNEAKRFELRSPDGNANVYLAMALIIYAGVEGVLGKFSVSDFEKGELPDSLDKAKELSENSKFIKKYLPAGIAEKL